MLEHHKPHLTLYYNKTERERRMCNPKIEGIEKKRES